MQELPPLNPEQQAAVDHLGGPMLVVAGAGTGKTQVITRRIAQLMAQGHAKPQEILALTFTEKAATEMADRLYGLVGWPALSARIMTFNSFGLELMMSYGRHVGRGTQGGLLSETKKTLLLKQHLDDITFEYFTAQHDRYGFAQELIGYIGRLQNAGISAEQQRAYAAHLVVDQGEVTAEDILEQADIAAVYEHYEYLKTVTGTYDYSDQLTVPLKIIEQRPNIVARLKAQYKFVLVDEYQDTSPVQDQLLRQLVPPNGNIFVVGDDDQAIYKFRGADINGILAFSEHFHEVKNVALIQNYRSGQPILDAAYRLIKNNNPHRLEVRLEINKELVAQHQEASVSFTPYASPGEELSQVVDAISRRLDAGELGNEIAVLSRSNQVLLRYAGVLRERGISYSISTASNLFEQTEMIQLWHTLTWIGNVADDNAISHVAVGLYGGVPVAKWQPVVAHAKAEMIPVETALRALAEDGSEPLANLVQRLDTWRRWASSQTVTQLVFRVLAEAVGDEAPLLARLTSKNEELEQDDNRVMRLVQDIRLFLNQLDDYVSLQKLEGRDPGLLGYLAEFPVPPKLEIQETSGDANGVQLLTVHASKGLEFDTVYLVGTTASAWRDRTPTGLTVPEALLPPDDLPPEHEQRRLMYVAITRARKTLEISAAVRQAGGNRQAICPLVAELLSYEPNIEPTVSAKPSIAQAISSLQQFYPLAQAMPVRLPFETSDGWLEIGVNDLYAYDFDPHDFYVQKVLGLSRPFGPQLGFGKVLHAAFERYYKARLNGEEVTLDELISLVGEQWRDEGYETPKHAADDRHRAERTVQAFFEREEREDRVVIASEQPITLLIPEARLRLRGRIDATFRTTDGLEIRDFKTGMKRDPEALAKDAKNSFQLRCYDLALEQLTGEWSAAVTLDYVVTGVEGTGQLTTLTRKKFREKLVKLADGLRERDFSPRAPSQFHQGAASTYYGQAEVGEGE